MNTYGKLAWIGGAALVAGLAALWWSLPPGSSPLPAALQASGQAETQPPNVLILLWDTVRADRLSIYGYEKPTTPHLQARADEWVVYERALSPGIWTLPAHASMFTGLHPESTGADERWLWLDEQHITLAEHFSDHGYDTFSFAANALLSEDTNLVQGFEVQLNTWKGRMRPRARQATREKLIPEDRSTELSPLWQRPDHGARNAEWARAVYKEAAPLISRTLVRWLDRKPEPRPWLAYLNFMEAHTPRIPSMEARQAVMDEAQIALSLQTDQSHIALHFYNFGKQHYSDEELQAINGVYDATLVELDQTTERLLGALERRGFLDNTIVILTSDHGENLGDHGMFNHRFGLWDTLAHVPLLVRYPAGMEPGRVAEAVSTQELFATLLQLTGLPEPEGPYRGPGLCQADGPGACPGTVARAGQRPVPVTHMALPLEREIRSVAEVHPDVEVEPWLRWGHAVHGAPHKLVQWGSGAQELYDVATDPAETDDRAGALPEVVGALHQTLRRHLQAMPPYDPGQRTARDDPRTVRAGQEDLRNQLEALGYIQDEE